MISEACCSRALQRRRLSTPADWTQLPLGFRFHPTDEELLGYYLKRKVTSQLILVDAIAVVDLYRFEPWELPPLSRLRSRDKEWYFFTSLDRKYATRCRNNRATVDGYWKTTCKDRPVHHRSRILGMKKALVYHAGRASRARRTNWVMHEYRLEDEHLARQGIQMDGYVLCKVFQKGGTGPQNEAQYGALFIDEEWEMEEEEDDKLVPVNVERGDSLMEPTVQNYVQLDDFFQDTGLGIEPVDVVNLEASHEHEFDGHTENSAILIEEIFKNLDSTDITLGAEFFAQHDSNIALNGLVANNCIEDQLSFASIQNNGFVQLSDIFYEEKSCSTSNLCLLQLLDGPAGGELFHSNNYP